MFKVKAQDTVKVISGKDRGKEGKVVKVLKNKGKIVVDKVNVVKKHTKQTQDAQNPGGIIETERPIDISNVKLICKACNKPTRVGLKLDKGKKNRYCKKCNESLD
jgi:large subunit ribosomal protein L24